MHKVIKNEGNVRASREREELLLEGTRQDGVINFNLHCATPPVIYLRVRSVREQRLGRHAADLLAAQA